MNPATLFAYMWVFAVLPSLTSAIVVVKAITIFIDWKGRSSLK
jgi:hypothetical protein